MLAVRILLAALVGVAGLGAAFSGALMFADDPVPGTAIPLLVGGLVVGVGGLWGVRRITRRYHLDQWQAAMDDPASVFAHWTDAKGRDVLFARRGLFLSKRFYAFSNRGSNLTAASFENGVLSITIRHDAGETAIDKHLKVDVPDEHRAAVAKGVGSVRRG